MTNFPLEEIRFNEVLTECPLFSCLSTQEIVNIRMKSTERNFDKNTRIIIKGREVKHAYIIVSGSVREDFENFYLIRGIGNVLDPYDFTYQEPSKCLAKASTDIRTIQMPMDLVHELLDKYPAFKKKWYKSIFPYSLRLERGLDYIENSFSDIG